MALDTTQTPRHHKRSQSTGIAAGPRTLIMNMTSRPTIPQGTTVNIAGVNRGHGHHRARSQPALNVNLGEEAMDLS